MASEDRSRCPKCGSDGKHPDGGTWYYACGSRWFDHHDHAVQSDRCVFMLMTAERDKWKARAEKLEKATDDALEALEHAGGFMTVGQWLYGNMDHDRPEFMECEWRRESAKKAYEILLSTVDVEDDEALADSAEVANG